MGLAESREHAGIGCVGSHSPLSVIMGYTNTLRGHEYEILVNDGSLKCSSCNADA